MLTVGQRARRLSRMRRRSPKQPAPEGFLRLLRRGMEKRGKSLNQVAEEAGISPAFLSRILNQQRGLPSNKVIVRLAQVLDLQPRERLLIEAGRVPEDLKPTLLRVKVPDLLRALGKLSDSEQQELLRTVQGLILKQRRGGKRS